MTIHTPIAAHNLALSQDFLSKLDPSAKKYCFALFDDHKPTTRTPKQFFTSLNALAPQLLQLNSATGGYGAFVTVNATDGNGRKTANVIRARALWADCDAPGTLDKALATCQAADIEPSWVTRTSGGKGHIYFFVDDLALEDFDRYEPALITALGADTNARDRCRVLRLPGSLHLKDTPQAVTGEGNGRHYTLAEVANALNLDEALLQSLQAPLHQSYTIRLEEVETPPLNMQMSSVFTDIDPCHFDELSAGIVEDTMARVFQAGLALAFAKVLADRDSWRDFWLFPLARLAVENPGHEDAIKEIFDEICEKAGGDTSNNEIEWANALRGTAEKLAKGEAVRGVGSVFNKAAEYGQLSPEAVKAHAGNIAHPWKTNATVGQIERYDDIGNGRRLKRIFGNDIRYVGDANFWRVWGGDRWVNDKSAIMDKLAIDIVEHMHRRADELLAGAKIVTGKQKKSDDDSLTPEQKAGKALKVWAHKCGEKSQIRNMIDMGKHLCVAHQIDFDRDTHTLGVSNGSIDLCTGKFRPPARENYLTKLAGVLYNSSAQCPNWRAFLDKVMGGDQELVEYLQRAVGYTLTGSVAEEVMFVTYGRGANGKTTFIETLMDLFQDYGTASDASLLMRQHGAGGGASPDIAKLKAVRLVTVNETEEGGVLNEDRMKYLVSKSQITARNLYSEPFTFMPTHKVWMATNHKPTIKSSDLGTWRRIHLIPFRVTFSPDERVPNFREDYLLPELSGILNWAIAGALMVQKDGLQPPKAITDATNAYREDLDFVQRWIDECCAVDDPQLPPNARTRTKLSWLHRNFRAWAVAEKAPDLSSTRFAQELELRGFDLFKSLNGNQRMVRGVAARIDPNDELSAGISTPAWSGSRTTP